MTFQKNQSKCVFVMRVFCYDGFSPGDFLPGRHFQGSLQSSVFFNSRFISKMDFYIMVFILVICCPGGFLSWSDFHRVVISGCFYRGLLFFGWLKSVTPPADISLLKSVPYRFLIWKKLYSYKVSTFQMVVKILPRTSE